MTIAEAEQRSELGVFIELFTLDATPYGGGIICWTPSNPSSATPIIWGGNTYTAVDVKAEGFERSTAGVSPRPQLTVSNADNLVGFLMASYGDLLGCQITRTKTLYEFLDDQPGADPEQYWPLDIFRVERKVSQDKNKVVLELASAIDNIGAKIPRYVVLRDTCPLLYRRYVGSSFVYTNATCPYTGTGYYTKGGVSTTAANDVCGKHLSDCKLRFGASAELPYGGFPGAAKVNV